MLRRWCQQHHARLLIKCSMYPPPHAAAPQQCKLQTVSAALLMPMAAKAQRGVRCMMPHENAMHLLAALCTKTLYLYHV